MAQNPFGKFLEDLDLRDQAHGKIAERIKTRWDRFYNSTYKDYYVYSEDGRVLRRVNFQNETPDQGFLEVTVVDADSEKQARSIAAENCQDEGREVWLSNKQTQLEYRIAVSKATYNAQSDG